MITMEDIAKICGVSRQTVHVALNGKPGVSEETRNRIQEVVRKYNYQPNKLATTLLHKTSNLIGVTVLDIKNPFFGDLIQGINSVLNNEGLHMIFFEASTKEQEDAAIDNLLAYQVAGMITTPVHGEGQREHYKSLLLRGTPFVTIGPIPGLESNSVQVEDEEAGRISAEYFIQKGHRKICYLRGPDTNGASGRRATGFLQYLEENNIAFDQANMLKIGDTAEAGYQAALKIFDCPPGKRCTGLICFNDLVAVGVYKAAQEREINIPEDVSIIGCDNVEITRLLGPPLTTISLPILEMGQSAAELLISQLRGEQQDGFVVKSFPPSIVERDSVRELNVASVTR